MRLAVRNLNHIFPQPPGAPHPSHLRGEPKILLRRPQLAGVLHREIQLFNQAGLPEVRRQCLHHHWLDVDQPLTSTHLPTIDSIIFSAPTVEVIRKAVDLFHIFPSYGHGAAEEIGIRQSGSISTAVAGIR